MGLTKAQKEERLRHMYNMLKDGFTSNDVITHYREETRMTENAISTYMAEAMKLGEILAQKDKDYIFGLHMTRYEKTYKKELEQAEKIDLNDPNNWNWFIQKMKNCLSVLRAKEKLLGLHNKSVNIQFNNNVAHIEDTAQDQGSKLKGISIGRLTVDELIELRNLIEVARIKRIDGVFPTIIKEEGPAYEVVTAEEDVDTLKLPENVVYKMQIDRGSKDESAQQHIDELKKTTGNNDLLGVTSEMRQKSLDQFKSLLQSKKTLGKI